MELVDDDVETMIALYCGNGSDKNSPIHLFAELAGMEQNEDLTAYGEEHATEEPRVVAPISYVDSESTIRGIDIDLNLTPDIDVVGDDGYDNSDHCDEEVDSDSDPDVDDVLYDIDDEDVNDDGNINASSVGNQMRRIMIHNNPGPHMSLIDPNEAHEAEFPEYPEILPAHRLAINSNHEELLMWEIRKFVGPHTCTSIHMTEDHGKLDSKTICTFIMPMVKDMPTIKVSVLIAEMQARFQYRVSYRKAWIAKQMAMEQLYRDFDASYNELQGWIAAMREYRTSWSHIFFAKEWLDLKVTWKVKRTHLSNSDWHQVNQIEAGYVFVEDVRDTMVANRQMARSINVEIYSRRHETFRVTETIGRRPGIPPRSYGVDLRNRRLAGHNRRKCPQRNYHIGQSSRSSKN
ncbi:hypothetical protein GOBAR_AA07771 [Gossypium barbadense]|uniref:Transposase MuDR plant domain-containing protein n=1 Tax=Gossypium barbadense TaxID=3634 RepID=A0A2P5YB89_GOSBA|nr:hypothetical protein GOBAR_AA07771 [Gossypium barbadense]